MQSQDRRVYTVEGTSDLTRFQAGAIFLWAVSAGAEQTLPNGPGKATVERVCSACHMVEVFAGKAHTKDEWSDIVDEMKNAGAKATKAEFRQIVTYLAKSFPKR